MRRPLVLAALSLLLLAPPATAAAQDAPAPGPRPPATQAISVNPLYIPFGAIVVEYERATAPGISLGASGGYYEPVGGDDESYASAEAKLRFYPGERAPRGFSIGVTAGLARTSDDNACCDAAGRGTRRTETGATTGVVLDYNWLIGRTRRFFVGTGIGAKRLFGDLGEDDFFDIDVLPLARLQIGAAF